MQTNFIKRFLSSILILPISLILIISSQTTFVIFLLILLLISIYEWIKMCNKNLINQIFGIIFLILSFFSAFNLKNYTGLEFFIFLILICVFTDVGGYLFGKIFKGPKLTKISPNKTYSGMAGSFIVALIVGFTLNSYIVLPSDILEKFSLIFLKNQETKLFSLIIVISLVSQLGDLIISYFKRIAKIKDTGKILPGHGGLLDRIDGLIFAIPTINLLIIF